MCRAGRRLLVGLTILALGLAGCGWNAGANPFPIITPTMPGVTSTEKTMVVSVQITSIQPDRGFYKPGDQVHLLLTIQNVMEHPIGAKIVAEVSHLEQPVSRIEMPVKLVEGQQNIRLTLNPPADAPRGYGVDLNLLAGDGGLLASAHTAFDVLERWTQMPRYGFLTDFAPGRNDEDETMAGLIRYHINALQFYDWMYRHDQFFTPEEPYRDPLGRTLSLATVERLIAAAHRHGIAAMPYTAVYASSLDFFHQHPDYAMLGADGKPLFFGDNFLVYMDARPDSAWTRHLLAQFDEILNRTDFDGIHLDQYGDPKVAYDRNGSAYDLAPVLAEFINATHALVASHRSDGATVFNAVDNWPIESVAPSNEDIVYIEVWPPYTWWDSLSQLIIQGQKLGGGKAVVLAAYIDPSLERNVRLMDAIVFASGGGHIELGEKDGLLADAYFPRYGKMSIQLAEVVRRYYDFAVRYEDALGPHTRDATGEYSRNMEMHGAPSDAGLVKDKVMVIARESQEQTAVNLINLLGVDNPEWKAPLAQDPRPLDATTVRISGVQRAVKAVRVASPDESDPSLQPLAFHQAGETVEFQLPGLKYWSMILIEWGN